MYNYVHMSTTTINVSTARRKFSDILDKVFLENKSYTIVKRSIPVAIITFYPKEEEINVDAAMKKTFGSLPTFPDITKDRVSRRKKLSL